MKRKLFTFLLSATMLSCTLSIPSFAAEDSTSLSSDTGEYIEDSSEQDFTNSHTDNVSSDEETVLSDIPDEDSPITPTPTPTGPPVSLDSDSTVPTPTPDIPDTDITDSLPAPDTDPDSNTPTPTPEISDSSLDIPTPTPAPLTLKYKSGTLNWMDYTTVTLQMTVDGPCKWYYFFVDAGSDTSTIKNMYVATNATYIMPTSGTFAVTAKNVPESDSWLVVCAKPDSGATAKLSVVKLNGSSFLKKRPAATPTVTIRAAKTYNVNESIVSGLDGSLKFFPGKFYDFTVTGAGMDNTSPVQGDERWYPLYWSTKKNPSTEQQNTTWRIGSGKGIKDGASYNIYIFLKKQVYDGKEWGDVSPEEIKYITGSNGKILTFTAASITDSEWNSYVGIEDITETPTVSPTPPTLQMKVNTRSITLRTGQSISSVKVTNATPYFRVVAWYSDDTTIAKVNSYGKITAGKKTGKTYINIVMSTGETAKIKVIVQKEKVKTKSISGLNKKIIVSKNKTLKLNPVLSPTTTQEKITYSSSNPKVATVSSKGTIKGVKAGTAKIAVKSGSKKVVVTVTVPKTTTKKISGIKSTLTIKKGKTSKLKPKLSPSNSDDKISYSSSNKKVATVNSKGIITAKKKGKTIITVKSGKKTVRCKIRVK